MADAIATTAGSVLGTSTITTFVESASGVEQGGRTGLASLVTALLFLLAVFFSPLVSIVPACATAPALVMVGIFMIISLKDLDFGDWTNIVPAAVTIFSMPFSYSIATGIEFGVITYVVMKTLTGKKGEISKTIYILAAIFILKEIFFR
jgi:AGZA family xanthine/uracil permease-like MFS transporter